MAKTVKGRVGWAVVKKLLRQFLLLVPSLPLGLPATTSRKRGLSLALFTLVSM